MKLRRDIAARLGSNCDGAAAVEFAVVGPAVLLLLIGVLQIGIAMQSYNAIRNVTADTARFAVVRYQRGETPSNAVIEAHAQTIATAAPYLLTSDAFEVVVADASTQRVTGVRELTLTVTYSVPALLPLFGWSSLSLDFSRPIFVKS